jgi:hypothetical protein
MFFTFQKLLHFLTLHQEKPGVEQETLLVLVESFYFGVCSAKKRTTITVMLSDDPRCTASSASRAA